MKNSLKPLLIKPNGRKISNGVREMCRLTSDGNLFFYGDINTFCIRLNDKFSFIPPTENETQFITGTILLN